MHLILKLVLISSFCSVTLPVFAQSAAALSLEARLLAEDRAGLVLASRTEGDARRGAILFHQPHMACTKCHSVTGDDNVLGPDLTQRRDDAGDAFLIESLLQPSTSIRKGYESIAVQTTDGRTVTGLLVEQTAERIVLRDVAHAGRVVTFPASEIEQTARSAASIMPAGQVNQLASRQQFLDLVRYLVELRDGGLPRAKELQPAPGQFALVIPEYESRINHAGIIAGLDAGAFERGRAIYERLCVNCHGTHEHPGSLPTSLRFADGKFKNGSDPFTIYQTLTRGFGLMAPQTWMVPQQKYDVIHYLREAYLRPHNPSQHFDVSGDYLAGLPRGDTRGPEPSNVEPWVVMDYGPSLINTYEVGRDGSNFAHKGIAVRLDPGAGGISRGRAWMVFDHDTLRMAAAWTGNPTQDSGNFVDWNGIHFNGRHQVHPRLAGSLHVANPTGPGWADPQSGSFEDNRRVVGRDGRRYGPLPRAWGDYRGLYHHGDRAIISYRVGTTDILEMPGAILPEPPIPLAGAATPQTVADMEELSPVFTRTFNIGPRDRELVLQVATHPARGARLDVIHDDQFGAVASVVPPSAADGGGRSPGQARAILLAGILPARPDASWVDAGNGRLRLRIPAGDDPLHVTLWMHSTSDVRRLNRVRDALATHRTAADLVACLRGGPPRWPESLVTAPLIGADDGPFAVDVLTHPVANPWLAQLRFTGLDFFPDGDRAAVCAWDGDVWLVSGLLQLPRDANDKASATSALTWRRIASGLFQPLGLKIVAGVIHVTCRDQLVILRDLNGDGETDFYESFNHDHQVTEHFHEFAMGLQVDDAGDFYYAKSARHALPAVVPHHGTLLRVSADGSRTDILATGFRAANGVCLNPDGTFIVTDQEGHWNPKNRINWVREGGFYGNMFGYHEVTDASDAAMEQPLCWITNSFDRSPAELLWVDSRRWGPLEGALLNLSYGYGQVHVVPFEDVEGRKQGGLCALPIPRLPTGIMRGRFHPIDGQLYTCGMFAWAGNQTAPGGLYRIRATGKPMYLPIGLSAVRGGLRVTFTDPLDRAVAADPASYAIKVWSLKRSSDYGSDHYGERELRVSGVSVSDDARSVLLHLDDLRPTWCMEVRCSLRGAEGELIERVIHNTVHALND